MINLKKKDEQACGLFVSSKYQASLNFQRPLFVKYNEWYRIYRAIRDEGQQNYAGRAKLFIPYVFSTIETIIPRLIGAKPNVEAVPRDPSDILKAKANSELMNYEWDMIGMKKILKTWVKQALIYGTGVLKLTWEYDEDMDIDMPKPEVVDLFDFFYNPDSTNIQDGYVIHRTERNITELRKNENYTVPKELVTSVTSDEYKIQRDAILGLSVQKDRDSKLVELLEYWGPYDFGEGPVQALITVANGTHVLRAEPNPFQHGQIPFIKLIDIEDPHRFEGIGEVEQLASLQYELNDVRNQRMDNVTLILNRMWKVVKTGDVDEEDLISQAGQIVHVGEKDALEVIVTPDVTQSAYNEESMIKQDMQQVSGVSDYTRGMGDTAEGGTGGLNRTATGIMMLQEASNARFKYKLDNIEDSLVEFGKQLLGLNQQFVTKDLMLRVTNQEWIEIPVDEIKGQYDIVVQGGSTQPMSKSVRRAEARELLQTVLPLAQMGLPINLQYFLKNLTDQYDLQNPEEAMQQASMPGGVPAPGTPDGMATPGGEGLGSPSRSPFKSQGASAVEGLSGPEFTGLTKDTLSNIGNG